MSGAEKTGGLQSEKPRRSDLSLRRAPHAPSLFAFLLLFALLVAGVAGRLGGGDYRTVEIGGDAATLRLTGPPILRSGEMFELEIVVESNSRIDQAVIGISTQLWRKLTINSFYPAAAEEEYVDGQFRFKFGALDPGEQLFIKIDGQVNENRVTSLIGEVSLLDGERSLENLETRIKVLF